jgi:hypothetical protein
MEDEKAMLEALSNIRKGDYYLTLAHLRKTQEAKVQESQPFSQKITQQPSLCQVAEPFVETSPSLKLDFNIDARRQVELHERIDGFGRRLINIDNSAMGSGFKMLP